MRNTIIIIKLGGSIITDKSKPYTLNLPVIKRLAKEIKKANIPVIIVHGAGSFAHTSAKKYGGKKGYSSLWGVSKVARDAQALDQIMIDELIDAKIPAISFRPNSLFVARKGQLASHNLIAVLEALRQGLVPVLYGDVILDESWKTTIFSGETSTKYLVGFLQDNNVRINKVIQVGITNGVYDLDGVTIPEISKSSYTVLKKDIFESRGTDVTGGMKHKVENALEISSMGVKTYIVNGLQKGTLIEVLQGKVIKGTIVT